MNTKSLTLKIAALGMSVAALISAQSAELSGKVPVDFQIASKSFDAGTYRVTSIRPGVFTVKNQRGTASAITMLPVQTKTEQGQKENTISFKRSAGGYELSGICLADRGCWSKMEPATKSAEKIEVAMIFGR